MGYNTKLVKPEDVPKSYEDLLRPRWSGNFGIEASDIIWFAAVAKAMGEERGLAYFQKLAAMKPQIRSGHTLMTELVAAGEIPVVLTLYNQAVDKLKERGAPIDWKPLPPHSAAPTASVWRNRRRTRTRRCSSRISCCRLKASASSCRKPRAGESQGRSSFDQRDFRIVELARSWTSGTPGNDAGRPSS